MKMPTTYTKTCIRQYCRYHTKWAKEAFLPAQLQGVQKGHMDVSQNTVGVKQARDVAQELRLAEDQLGDAPVPPRGPGAREGVGAGPLQDFLPDEH